MRKNGWRPGKLQSVIADIIIQDEKRPPSAPAGPYVSDLAKNLCKKEAI
jgi:hypothetical protein